MTPSGLVVTKEQLKERPETRNFDKDSHKADGGFIMLQSRIN